MTTNDNPVNTNNDNPVVSRRDFDAARMAIRVKLRGVGNLFGEAVGRPILQDLAILEDVVEDLTAEQARIIDNLQREVERLSAHLPIVEAPYIREATLGAYDQIKAIQCLVLDLARALDSYVRAEHEPF